MNARVLRHRILLPTLAWTLSASLAAAQCPEFSNEFSSAGADGPVNAHTVVQWGGIPQLLVAGDFGWIGEVEAPRLALFDGTSWSGFPAGAPGPILAVAQYDYGLGNQVWVGGDGFLANWDGVTWTSRVVGGEILALHVHDDGNESSLWVGGNYSNIDGQFMYNVARFDGAWDNLGGGAPNPANVRAFETFDDGGGPLLYVGGRFDSIGGSVADGLASWDGASFTEVSGGIDGGNGRTVLALQTYTPPGGSPELHVGGNFTGIGGISTSPWIALGAGGVTDVGGGQFVNGFTLREEASITTIHARRESKLERYDGTTRTNLPLVQPSALTDAFAFGTAPQELFLSTADVNEAKSNLGRWDGANWVALFSGPGVGMGITPWVQELAVHDFGAGEKLVVFAGTETNHGSRFLEYDGTTLSPLNLTGFMDFSAYDSLSHDGMLYVSGSVGWSDIGVVRLNGTVWEIVGAPFPVSGPYGHSVEVYDAGSGPEIHFGGRSVGDLAGPGTIGITRFDGTDWVSVGGGVTQSALFSTASYIHDLERWNDGAGEALFMGGSFRGAGGVSTSSIARWDGASWSPLAEGIWDTRALSPTVFDMKPFNGPDGERLIVTGAFNRAGTIEANAIAAWDGSSWSPLGLGLQSGAEAGVGFEMVVHDPDGQGERLYVYGSFITAGTESVEGVAVWDGVSWSSTDMPYTHQATLASFDDGSGRSLFVGGNFSGASGTASLNIAKYTDPCGSILGQPDCTSNPNSTGLVGLTRATGSASVSDDDLVVEARRIPPGAFTLFFAGTGLQHNFTGDGVLCVQGSLKRMYPGVFASAGGVTTKAFDFQAPYAANAVPGQSLVLQGFFRDVAGGPAGFNTTDALVIHVRP